VPTQFTLVPVRPGEVTSDHGWDLPSQRDTLAPTVERLKRAGMRVALFMDPEPDRVVLAAQTGADRIEIYTEPYASAFGGPSGARELERVRLSARAARGAGLHVNAGHDLSLQNLPALARAVPEISEVSIGHALIADALYLGLEETVRRYLAATRGTDVATVQTK
jgi:pyridoxine 5-phosphate synthase